MIHSLNQKELPSVGLKWPNDLETSDSRKLGGILLQSHPFPNNVLCVLVGVGLNMARADTLHLPADIENRYVGLEELLPTASSDEVLKGFLSRFEELYGQWASATIDLVSQWSEVDLLRDTTVTAEAQGQAIVGIARGINEAGELRIETESGLLGIRSGEVQRVRRA
jgi:BirA family biotin operon repressor/biotin-[acetyl-CoA-carboxylase] ligase